MTTAATRPRLLFLLSSSRQCPASRRKFPIRISSLAYLQCSQRDTDSLPLFATDSLCFHPLTGSFHKNREVWGYVQSNIQMTSSLIPSQKGEKPRLAWGEANPGLGGELRGLGPEELVAAFGGASSMTQPLTRQLRCPCRREGNGATTQLQTLVNRIHGEHADLPQLFVSKIGVLFVARGFRSAEAGLMRDAPQFLFGDSQQHRSAPRGHKLQSLL